MKRFYRGWTWRERQWLREVYGLLPPTVIAAVLDRNVRGVQQMAKYMGVSAKGNQAAYVERALAERDGRRAAA